jgi:hypothetical protein
MVERCCSAMKPLARRHPEANSSSFSSVVVSEARRPSKRRQCPLVRTSFKSEHIALSLILPLRVLSVVFAMSAVSPLRHRQLDRPRPKSADIVAKVFFGRSTKVLKTVDALRARRLEGPHRFIPKRPPAFVLASESIAAARVSKNQLSRDFRRHSIFDFCNNIGQKLT